MDVKQTHKRQAVVALRRCVVCLQAVACSRVIRASTIVAHGGGTGFTSFHRQPLHPAYSPGSAISEPLRIKKENTSHCWKKLRITPFNRGLQSQKRQVNGDTGCSSRQLSCRCLTRRNRKTPRVPRFKKSAKVAFRVPQPRHGIGNKYL